MQILQKLGYEKKHQFVDIECGALCRRKELNYGTINHLFAISLSITHKIIFYTNRFVYY